MYIDIITYFYDITTRYYAKLLKNNKKYDGFKINR